MKNAREKNAAEWGRPAIGYTMDTKQNWPAGPGSWGSAGNGMQHGETDYFRAKIQTDRKVFADEVVKHDMLLLLWKQSVRWRYEVVAFTLLDDQLDLILARKRDSGRDSGFAGESGLLYSGAGQDACIVRETSAQETYGTVGTTAKADPGREILEDLRRGCEMLYVRSADGKLPPLHGTSSWQRLDGADDMLRETCSIHQMPVEGGYVDSIAKYWWTSYVSYRGKYYWNFLNCRELLDHLSEDPAKASAMFCRRQSSFSHINAARGKTEFLSDSE